MKNRLLSVFALVLLLFPLRAPAEQPVVVNLVEDAMQDYQLEANAPLLEIIFPRVISSDCAILRFEDQVMMIDSSTHSEKMNNRILTACQSVGIDHIDIAYNSHPHNDHIDGFPDIHEQMPIGEFITTFPDDFDFHIKQVTDYMRNHDVPIKRVYNGDVMALGDGSVTLTVIQELRESWPLSDQSAMLMVQYGDRRILFTGDNENRSQKYYVENPPACGLHADILKYPHHGQVRLNNDFLALISPSLAFLDGAADAVKEGVKYCRKNNLPYLLSYKGLTRLRTDGKIWVVDYLKEENADRELPYTPARE